MTTRPFGNQVGDVVTTKYLSDTFISGVNVGTTPTINASTTLSTDQGLAVGEVLSVADANVTAGNYHLVLGGDRTAVVQALPGNQVTVVESGSKLVPSTTYELSHPIFPFEFEGIVVQQCNSGGHFQDSNNTQREQFLTSVPNLPSNTSCVAAKTVDGACMRMRIPYGLELNEAAGAGTSFPRSGNVQRIASLAPPRVAFHIEDDNASTKIKPGHAQDVMGLGRRDLAMNYTLTLPNAMNVDPVHYLMVKFSGLNSRRGEQLHYANGHLLRDVVGKVILGAPTTLVRSLVNKIEISPQTLTQVEVSFYLPDGKTKYNFHGLDHTLTLNLIIQERTLTREQREDMQDVQRKRKFGVLY
jgi:hypothetical protein